MMKVLILSDINSPHTRKWALGLAGIGMEVGIYSFSPPASGSGWWQSAGIRLLSSSHVSKLYRIIGKASYILHLPSLRAAISVFAPDVLHAHYASSYGLLGAMSGFRPFVVSVWGSDVFEFPKKSWINRKIISHVFSHATRIFSTSKSMAVEAALYTSKEIVITPFGVDTGVFFPGLPSGKDLTIGLVKSMEPVYGIPDLLRAFRLVKDGCPGVALKLVLVGGGSCLEEYRYLSVSLGFSGDEVRFVGRVEHDQVPLWMRGMDIVVNPSIHESFGVSVLEASASGKPVVATKVGGLPEVVVDGVTGLLVPPNDPASLAEAIIRLVKDKDFRSRLGAQGAEFVRLNFEWKTCLDLVKIQYESLRS